MTKGSTKGIQGPRETVIIPLQRVLHWVNLDFPNRVKLALLLVAVVKVSSAGTLGLFSTYPKNRPKKRAEGGVSGTTANTKALSDFWGQEAM